MMEFFLSKVWVFLVGIVLLGVLLQGMQLQTQAERSSSLKEVAESIQELLMSMERIGDGLERVVELQDVLPSSATLTINDSYMVLEDLHDRLLLEIPSMRMFERNDQGQMQALSSIVLHPGDIIKVIAREGGLTIYTVSSRTSPPGI
ncbi:MAG TPA: hypothetical protein VMW85_00245 [Methanomassiliicoccales archaeon]|nr:hypothetical protein [Methanomassiliicoccales archaeon]